LFPIIFMLDSTMLKSIQSNTSPGHSHNGLPSVVDLSVDSCPGILLKRNNKMKPMKQHNYNFGLYDDDKLRKRYEMNDRKMKHTQGKWVAKSEISMDDLMRGVNINTKQELVSGGVLYSKYCINKVMPKTVDVTTITHIDYGTERADRSYRSNKDILVRMINYEGVVNVYLPKEGKQ